MSDLMKNIEAILEHADLPINIQITADHLEWLRVAKKAMDKRFVLQVWDYDSDDEAWSDHSWYPTGFEAETAMIGYGKDHPTLPLRVRDTIMATTVVDKAPEPPKPRFESLWDVYNASWIDMTQYKYLKDVNADETIVQKANTMGGGEFQTWVANYIAKRQEFFRKISGAGKRAFCDQARELIDDGQLPLTNGLRLADLPIEKQDPETVLLACTLAPKAFDTYIKGILASQ